MQTYAQPLSVGRQELRLAPKIHLFDLRRAWLGVRVEHEELPGVAAAHEDAVTSGVVDDAVGIVGSVDLAEHRVGLQVDHEQLGIFSVRDEAAADGWHQRHPVQPATPRDVGDNFPRGRVNHLGMGRPRHVQQVIVAHAEDSPIAPRRRSSLWN